MSRSRRRTPILPITTAPSEKVGKVMAHRGERAAVRRAIARDAEMPHAKLFGNPWRGEKDGKLYRGDAVASDLRK